MADTVRAIAGARVSVWSEGKVSDEDQLDRTSNFVGGKGWDLIGTFEDIDVSAIKVNPWQRPDLAPWITERTDEWDAIVFTVIDRAFRNMGDCVRFAEQMKAQKKILAFAVDGIVLDFRGDRSKTGYDQVMAELFLYLGAFFAQIEGNRFKDRGESGWRGISKKNRVGGGRPRYPFKKVPHPDGEGFTLELNPDTYPIVYRAGKMAISGMSISQICSIFDAEGVENPEQYYSRQVSKARLNRRKTPVPDSWNGITLYGILRSPSCMGYKTTGTGKEHRVARDENGMPIRLTDPIFTEQEWAELQACLKEKSSSKERTFGAFPFLGVGHCLSCGGRLHQNVRPKILASGNEVTYSYVYCKNPNCRAHNWKSEKFSGLLDELVQHELSQIPVIRRTYIPAEDYSSDLEAVSKAMSEVRAEKDAGLYDYQGGEEEYKERLERLTKRRRALEKLPQSPSHWVENNTGETYAEAYNRLDPEGRRQLLLSADIRLYMGLDGFEFRVPEDLKARVQKLTP